MCVGWLLRCLLLLLFLVLVPVLILVLTFGLCFSSGSGSAQAQAQAQAEAAGLLSAELAGSECGRGYSLRGDICFRHLLIKFSSLLRNDCFICPGASSQSQLKLDSSRRAVGRMFFCGSRCRSPVQEEVIRMKRFLVAVVAKLLKVYFPYSQFLFIFHLPPQSCDCRETRRLRRSS